MAEAWFVRRGANIEGPLSSGNLKRLAVMGDVTPETHVRKGTDGQWVEAHRVQGLFGEAAKPANVTGETAPSQPKATTDAIEDIIANWLGKPEPNEQSATPQPTAFDRPMPTVAATPIKRPVPSVPVSVPIAAPPMPQSTAAATNCRFCGETILATAKKCKHCGEFLDPNLAPSQQNNINQGWNPGVAAVLNFFVPGVGYLYMGRVSRGILTLIATPMLYGTCWLTVVSFIFLAQITPNEVTHLTFVGLRAIFFSPPCRRSPIHGYSPVPNSTVPIPIDAD